MTDSGTSEKNLGQIFLAELIGTFILIFIDAGGAVIASMSGGADIPAVARGLAAGLAVMAIIFSFGHISGAHINPAVSFAFFARGVFPLRRLPIYWLAQIAGACFAALLLRMLFADASLSAVPHGNFGPIQIFVMEVVLTFILVMVILSTAQRLKVTGPNAAIPVGATVAFCALIGRPVSDAIMNPARALGPALITADFERLALFIAAPLLGALCAALFTGLIHGKENAAEIEAAQGEKAKHDPDKP